MPFFPGGPLPPGATPASLPASRPRPFPPGPMMGTTKGTKALTDPRTIYDETMRVPRTAPLPDPIRGAVEELVAALSKSRPLGITQEAEAPAGPVVEPDVAGARAAPAEARPSEAPDEVSDTAALELAILDAPVLDPAGLENLLSVLGGSPELVFTLIERHRIDCEARRLGTLHCAHSPAGYRALEQRRDQWLARGAPVELYDREQAAPLIGSRAFYGALLDRRAGTVQPLAYAHGLARAAAEAGAKLFVDSPVLECSRQGQSWLLRTPPGGR